MPDGVRASKPYSALAHAVPGLGTEFMPPLDEGSFLLMPITMYHASIGEALELLQLQDMSIRAIPGSGRYVAVAAGHHGYNYGSLVLIDQSLPDDGAMSQVRRLTPEVHFPESESAPGKPHSPRGRHTPPGEVYGTPWPLDEALTPTDRYWHYDRHGEAGSAEWLAEVLYRNPARGDVGKKIGPD